MADRSLLVAGLTVLLVLLTGGGVAVRADEVHLRDGRVLRVTECWEAGGMVWYRQGGTIVAAPRGEVERLVSGAGLGGSVVAPRLAVVVLRDGTRIEADAAWEDGGRVVWMMGRMRVSVERAEVAELLPAAGEAARVEPPPALRFTTGHGGLDRLIVEAATRYRLDPLLIYLVMREESAFNTRAVSRAGARGLMQLMPSTVRMLGIRNPHNPAESVEGGTRYLCHLIGLFGGDVNLALAAYNAGEGAVLRHGRRVPPYRETRAYVWRINTAYHRLSGG